MQLMCVASAVPTRGSIALRTGIAVLLGMLALFLSTAASVAQTIETAAESAILLDAQTGAVLLAKNPDEQIPTASMSKIMTVFMVFEALKEGRLNLDDEMMVSENAWRKGGAASGGSTMFLELGSRATVEELLHGVIVQSGNDASIVLAEGLAGSEQAFADRMTARAHELGLTNSNFRNATGLPDPGHVSTARDLAHLARLTIEAFPELYSYYSEIEYTYNDIRQGNRNPLLYKKIGADGLKTGHTSEAGYGLTASAKQGDRRLILVVAGLHNAKERSEESERLLSWGFREFDNYALFDAGEFVSDADVWLGAEDMVPLVAPRDVVVTLPRTARRDMTVKVQYDGPLPAPIEHGQSLATLVVEAPGMSPARMPLVAGESVEQLGLVGRLLAALQNFVMSQIN